MKRGSCWQEWEEKSQIQVLSAGVTVFSGTVWLFVQVFLVKWRKGPKKKKKERLLEFKGLQSVYSHGRNVQFNDKNRTVCNLRASVATVQTHSSSQSDASYVEGTQPLPRESHWKLSGRGVQGSPPCTLLWSAHSASLPGGEGHASVSLQRQVPASSSAE